jgi:ammonia channel protein AmtB
MDGLPLIIHPNLVLKAINRTQRLGLKLRVEEEAENLGINVQSHGEKRLMPNE